MEGFEITLRYASTIEEAEELVQLLEQHQIPVQISKNVGNLDTTIIGELPTNKYEILIPKEQHLEAENILIEEAKKQLISVPEDYYLFSFSNDELLDVLIKADEWSELDVALAEKILNDRKVKIDLAYVEAEREQRYEEQRKPEAKQDGWILFGYVMAILGGFIGFLIGYALWTAKKRLTDGTKVPAYSEGVRYHGRNIFYLGFVMFILVSAYKALSWLGLI